MWWWDLWLAVVVEVEGEWCAVAAAGGGEVVAVAGGCCGAEEVGDTSSPLAIVAVRGVERETRWARPPRWSSSSSLSRDEGVVGDIWFKEREVARSSADASSPANDVPRGWCMPVGGCPG